MRALTWLFRVLIFLALFAFALNNQHEAALKWFFGQEWRAPMVFIVLAVFALGCVFGVLAMLPSWWRHRAAASRSRDASMNTTMMLGETPHPVEPSYPEHPPRDGL
jgi:uncharacterized integral membrane protein